VRLRANTPHVVVVTAETPNGTVLDTVFRDRVRDTATVHWTARGRQGARAPVGGFVIGILLIGLFPRKDRQRHAGYNSG